MKRQGDLYFTKIEGIPKGATMIPTGILVYGEATGHAHRVVGGKAYKSGDALFVDVKTSAQVVHDEHKPISLGKGTYGVVRQREYAGKDMVKIVVD